MKIIGSIFLFTVGYFMYCVLFGLIGSLLQWDIAVLMRTAAIFSKPTQSILLVRIFSLIFAFAGAMASLVD